MDAKIELIVTHSEDRSYIKSLYTTPPFRVVSVGQLQCKSAAYLMQMSTSPGVLSGDDYSINITVEDNARLQLKSQSYQRVYDMDGKAVQQINITIGESAHFSQVSHPIVPHRNSSFTTSSRVKMGDNSSFLQSEIITCGRKYHGESFEFRLFSNSIEVWHNNTLRLKDRVYLSPSTMPLLSCGLLEGTTHQGTLVFQTTENIDILPLIEEVYSILLQIKDIDFGISKSHYTGFVIRVLGNGGENLYNAFLKVQELLWGNK